MTTAFFNGDFLSLDQVCISPLDRGFLFADSVYEVIPVYYQQLFRFQQHFARLQRSLDICKIPNPYTSEQWQDILDKLIEANDGQFQSLYLQVTRGSYETRHHNIPAADIKPTVFAFSKILERKSTAEKAEGIKVVTAEDIRWGRCDIKSTALLGNILLNHQATEQGGAEVLLQRDGSFVEGASSNLFIVKDNVVYTPEKSHFLLGGVTRDLIVELLQANNIAVKEQNISADDLKSADEIWVSSSTREVLPVLMLDNNSVGNGRAGPVWQQITELYDKTVESHNHDA